MLVPAVTALPELISLKTADMPDLGWDGGVSELKSDAGGGGGGAGAFAGGALETEEAEVEGGGAETVVAAPAGAQERPRG